jgi:hypothetical protein
MGAGPREYTRHASGLMCLGNMAARNQNEVQDLQLRLMEFASSNNLDGGQVVQDLRANRNLWRAALMDSPNSLVTLAELEYGDAWNADTLFITPEPGQEDALELLTKRWKADQVQWIGGEEACGLLGEYSPERRANLRQILRVWWD